MQGLRIVQLVNGMICFKFFVVGVCFNLFLCLTAAHGFVFFLQRNFFAFFSQPSVRVLYYRLKQLIAIYIVDKTNCWIRV